ncbi:hypothetical protein E2562_033063 [Oryza meyeriana var. granulata]|uniref:Uncharacterized protein n=1 Tax=Oryza meyeriana var. granulata TaxID=110450 RepID=A0A6G1DTJ8_9ORYZ|nr:hypothetical protein E2562_033063 [Oryza meyeriana var. granulata]
MASRLRPLKACLPSLPSSGPVGSPSPPIGPSASAPSSSLYSVATRNPSAAAGAPPRGNRGEAIATARE